ncbi:MULTISPECIES: hypothetical protein [Halomonadaceae]|uniref:hypothetical protein n=1 Tax=Halomonadaceae TaxID=28256 RepID=UPI001597F5BB|nr:MULTISPECIES: hypothetical protein [Halomonas]QJQ96872.1 hypothetical protein HIO72_17345 [Halomonas sp. PA5]
MMRPLPRVVLTLPLTLTLCLPFSMFLAASAEAQRASTGPPDWPCVQRLVPELAWGTLWPGPSLDALERQWWEDEEVGRLVRFAAARETPREEALARIREFVERSEGEADREERLTLLFSGLFQLTDRERSRTIERIRGASRGQVSRLESVAKMVDELEEKRADEHVDPEEIEALSKALFWDQRAFESRQQALPALCEQPYLLEEKLSQMVRIIDAGL